MTHEILKDFGLVLRAMPAGHPRHRPVKLLAGAIREDALLVFVT